MSERLQKLVKHASITRSDEELAAAAAPCSGSTIRNARAGKPVGPKLAYRIALACGATEQEARDIAEGRALEVSA